jgi:cyclopropane fatty-acyl-phospholipid synthase-like methyltransferase
MATAGQNKAVRSVPFKIWLKAWWEGYDPVEFANYLDKKRAAAAPPPAAPAADHKPKSPPRDAPSDVTPDDLELPFDPWDANRIEIAQYIWGEGYCGPGGPEHIISMCKLLALSPEMSLLEIGANLGGPARTLADKYGTWVTGYETSERLVKLANEKSLMAGLAKKADIRHYSTGSAEGFGRHFDRALAKESLFTIENKANILGLVEEHLKPSGLFLITDFVLGSDQVSGKESFRTWRDKEAEKRRPYMVTAQELAGLVKKARFNVRVNEDVSATYIDLINRAWAGADKVAAQLARKEDSEDLLKALLKEAEFWSNRARMLESGDLRLWRILASKRSEKPSMLSDW